MGSLTNSPSSHSVSRGSADSARWRPRNPANNVSLPEVEEDDDNEEEVNVALCPGDCITGSSYMCHTDEEQASPSRSTLTEFVLPTKVHFRYCWLFSGVPWPNTMCLGDNGGPLTDREAIRANRALMSEKEPELCARVARDNLACQQDMKAFWLTTDGRLVYVERFSEDVKFRNLRRHNLHLALSLWTTNPELCGNAMRASALAHKELIKICGEAARLSRGRFYNLYANYPLPFVTDVERNVSLESPWVDERQIEAHEIGDGGVLLIELQPLYAAYFNLIADESTSDGLSQRVSLLGARWLVQEDYSELMFSLTLTRNWLVRMLVRIGLFLLRP